MRVGCIIQARLGSTRLPRKVLADIGGWAMVRHVWERMMIVGIPVIVATPIEDEGRIPVSEAYDCDPNDVLQRYLMAAKKHGLDAVMRVTGDCPLIDPESCMRVLDVFNSGHYDYVANDVSTLAPLTGSDAKCFLEQLSKRLISASSLKIRRIASMSPHGLSEVCISWEDGATAVLTYGVPIQDSKTSSSQ